MATKWVGWPNTAGSPDADPGTTVNYTNGEDRTYTRRWTANEAGTITGVNIRPSDNSTGDMFIIVYRQAGGTGDIDKIAQMDIGSTYTQDVWLGYTTAVVFGAESLDFDSGDILWFGVAFDGATGIAGLQGCADETSGEVNNQYNTGSVNPTTGPDSTLTFSTSGTYLGLSVILRYDDSAGATLTFYAKGDVVFNTPSIELLKYISLASQGNLIFVTSDIQIVHIYPDFAFGEQSPASGETAEAWSTWSDGAGGTPDILGDGSWGKLALASGEVGHSAVKDLLNTDNKAILVTKDLYGSGAGVSTIHIRGQATTFTQDAASPAWELYSSSVNKTWRYMQVRATG